MTAFRSDPIQSTAMEMRNRIGCLGPFCISPRPRGEDLSLPPPAGQWDPRTAVPVRAFARTHPGRDEAPTAVEADPPDRVPFARGHVARWLAARVSQPGPQRPLDGDGRRIGDHLANWPGGSCWASSIAYESGVTYRRRGVEQCGRRVVGADPTVQPPRPRRDRRLRSARSLCSK